MKIKDAQLIISAVGRAIRKQIDALRSNVTTLTEKLTQAESVIAQQRETIEKLGKDMAEATGRFGERAQHMESMLVALKNAEPPRVPSVDEIAERIKTPPPSEAQIKQIAEIVMKELRELPIEIIVERTLAAVPTPESIAKLVVVPATPTADEIAKLVTVPTTEEIAAVVLREVPTMVQVKQFISEGMPTPESIAKLVTPPVVPTAEEVAKLVVVPSAEDIAKLVPAPVVPTAEEIAKHVPVPELPTIELPELPEIPTLDQIMAGVKEILPSLIPAPVKGDTGKSITVDDVRPMIEELIKALPKPKDGKSLTIEDIRPLFAQWMLEFERLAVERHDKILAHLPKAKDGVDGLGFDHLRTLKAEQVGDRIIRFFVMRGEERIDLCDIKLSHPLYREVFLESRQYERGDQVTRDGCQWIALKDQPQGIPGSSDDWQLAVKKGRDGKDGTLKQAPPSQVRVAPRKE